MNKGNPIISLENVLSQEFEGKMLSESLIETLKCRIESYRKQAEETRRIIYLHSTRKVDIENIDFLPLALTGCIEDWEYDFFMKGIYVGRGVYRGLKNRNGEIYTDSIFEPKSNLETINLTVDTE